MFSIDRWMEDYRKAAEKCFGDRAEAETGGRDIRGGAGGTVGASSRLGFRMDPPVFRKFRYCIWIV